MAALKAGLRAAGLALALAAASPATATSDPLARWAPHVAEASARFGLPAEWIRRVIRAESGGRTALGGAPIVSRAGAMGLMQLMPATWAAMRARLGLGADPHDPRDNILAGTAYLRMMYDRFGYPGLFGAYNAGPARYARHLATGRPLPAETRAYLAAVAGPVPPARASEPPSAPGLFVLRRAAGPAAPAAGSATDRMSPLSVRALFVVERAAPDRPAAGGAPDPRADRLFARVPPAAAP